MFTSNPALKKYILHVYIKTSFTGAERFELPSRCFGDSYFAVKLNTSTEYPPKETFLLERYIFFSIRLKL